MEVIVIIRVMARARFRPEKPVSIKFKLKL